jgi:dihydroxy-acid dehydratase
MRRLADDLHLDALTVAGNTIGDVVKGGAIMDEDVIRDKARAYLPEGSTVILTGNLAPEGAVVKQSAVAPDMVVYSGKARVFESEHDCLKAIRERSIQEGEVVVIRNEGPKGAPGMPETLAVTLGLEFAGFKRVALITDGRFSGATAGPCIGHVSPEARVGGPIAAVRDGDEISIDIPGRKLDLRLSDEEIRSRLDNWKPVEREIPPGFMRRYVKLVSSAAKGAVLE